jgi:competence protein ComEC
MQEDHQPHHHPRSRAITWPVGGRMRVVPQVWHGYWLLGRTEIIKAFYNAIALEDTHQRLFLWLPVAAIVGVLLFFAADHDPSLWGAGIFAGGTIALVFTARRRPAAFQVSLLCASLASGFFLATLRTERIAAPVLEKPIWRDVEGLVSRVEPRPRGARVYLDVRGVDRLDKTQWPQKVRFMLPRKYTVVAGDIISVSAFWQPPPPAVRPDGYNFARVAFFDGLGGIGSRVRAVKTLPRSESTSLVRQFNAYVEQVRHAVAARIRLAVGQSDAGSITVALVNGQRGEISAQADEDMRLAGLYHVISISGLHMALFAGAVFAVLRLILVLVPGLALTHPIKAWAAMAALVCAFGYLLLSGADIPAVRSFVMVALVFTAIVFSRTAITQRNLALSATLVVVFVPEAVLGPSFQMSFAAVMALVAWYEDQRGRSRHAEPALTYTGRAVKWAMNIAVAAALTTLIATLATAPYAAFHFQQLAVHALSGNMLTFPIISVVIMPAALAGLVLMPLGLDGFAWRIMAWGVQLMLDVASWVAGWPAADQLVSAFSVAAVLLLSLGLVWLSLWISWLRWLGMIPTAFGIYMAATPHVPDVFIGPQGRAMAVRGPDGALQIIGARPFSLMGETWLAASGERAPAKGVKSFYAPRCDRHGCTVQMGNNSYAALDWSYTSLREDCGKATLIVTRLAVPVDCRSLSHVLDGRDLAHIGAAQLRLLKDGTWETRFAQPPQTSRKWYARHFMPDVPEGLEFAKAIPSTPVQDKAFPEDSDADDDDGIDMTE